ncbi:dihydroxyacetone kinase subunit DhaL [Acidilobus sp.]|uniref:dihydroxyacetone kinase subunit DhaL n=1 Tax=Acidilobus sp. TaxID=1872109 RepID=UPI003CFE6BAC
MAVEKITVSDFYNIILKYKDVIVSNEKYLTDLDAAIGDADHGINMSRGFTQVAEKLKSLDPQSADIGTILMTVATVVMETVGGASGPLYGTLFLTMGNDAAGAKEVDANKLVKMFEDALKAIMDLGGAKPGDKTMVDTLYPAVEQMKRNLSSNVTDLITLFKDARDAAENGMKSTVPLVARKGRASYLGERSAGHQDPGATSCYMLIDTIYNYLVEKYQKSG